MDLGPKDPWIFCLLVGVLSPGWFTYRKMMFFGKESFSNVKIYIWVCWADEKQMMFFLIACFVFFWGGEGVERHCVIGEVC